VHVSGLVDYKPYQKLFKGTEQFS